MILSSIEGRIKCRVMCKGEKKWNGEAMHVRERSQKEGYMRDSEIVDCERGSEVGGH